jgi:hypothetical protein
MDGGWVAVRVETRLVPSPRKGAIAISNDLNAHSRNARADAAIEAVGAE